MRKLIHLESRTIKEYSTAAVHILYEYVYEETLNLVGYFFFFFVYV